jgi:hypothetical protein
LALIRQKAIDEPLTFALFTSPGGNGLKILIRVNSDKEHHLKAFEQVKFHYEKLLGLEIDRTGKDITRLCFLSYDPEAWINPDSGIFQVITSNGIEHHIRLITELIEKSGIDITSDYENWRNLGFALADEIAENGREIFHRISRFNPDYNPELCNDQYSKCLNGKGSGITIATFFYIAKRFGIDISRIETVFPEYFRNQKSVHFEQQKPVYEKTQYVEPEIEHEKESVGKRISKRKLNGNRFHMAMKFLNNYFDILYNTVTNRFEYRKKDESEYKVLNENTIFVEMQLSGLTISINNLVALLKSDYIPKYNPFLKYYQELPAWDGMTDYILHLAGFVKVKECDRNRFDNHFKKWMVRMVKCSIVDDYFNKQAFILVHDRQNSGKSTFCRFLCPPKLKEYIAENISVDKDSRILLTTNLIINLDELSTLSKVEINALKSLFSKDKINERLPYDRRNSILPRRASFIGSTNQAEFLNDESGSVRWLCFNIESIDWSYKTKVNIDLVYTQCYYLFQQGWSCDLTASEIEENEKYNAQFQVTTSERELIEKFMKPGEPERSERFMTATEILIYLSEKTDNRVRLNVVTVGKALKSMGFERMKNGQERVHGYHVNFKYE